MWIEFELELTLNLLNCNSAKLVVLFFHICYFTQDEVLISVRLFHKLSIRVDIITKNLRFHWKSKAVLYTRGKIF